MTESYKGIALITGASTGIGAVYADRLARRGYDLVLVARSVERLEALATGLRAQTGRAVEVLAADLSDSDRLAQVSARLATEPNLSLLVNNAGIALGGTLATTPASEVAKLIALNVTAPTLLAQAALQAFTARQGGDSGGGIINISSVLALAPEMRDGVYSGSKAFVLNLTQGLAQELGPDSPIRVQAVLPGATRTEIWARSGTDIDTFPADWVMDAEDLVDAALAGFDQGETVTIPPLQDEAGWTAMQDARRALAPQLSRREVAPRYRRA